MKDARAKEKTVKGEHCYEVVEYNPQTKEEYTVTTYFTEKSCRCECGYK